MLRLFGLAEGVSAAERAVDEQVSAMIADFSRSATVGADIPFGTLAEQFRESAIPVEPSCRLGRAAALFCSLSSDTWASFGR